MGMARNFFCQRSFLLPRQQLRVGSGISTPGIHTQLAGMAAPAYSRERLRRKRMFNGRDKRAIDLVDVQGMSYRDAGTEMGFTGRRRDVAFGKFLASARRRRAEFIKLRDGLVEDALEGR